MLETLQVTHRKLGFFENSSYFISFFIKICQISE